MLVLTIIVKAAPLFATILCRWLGRLAIPIGDADSVGAGATFAAIESMRTETTDCRFRCEVDVVGEYEYEYESGSGSRVG